MQLDKAFIDRLRNPMWITWNAIGHDIIQCMEECGEVLDNEMAIEACIDANRLMLNGNDKEADDLVRNACVEHGYSETLKFLSKHFVYA
jgi:hypothetical protein